MYNTKNNYGKVDLFPQIDRVLNEIFNTTFTHAADEKTRKYSQPSANVIEFKDRFEIHVAAPGFHKEDIQLKVDKNILSISASKDTEEDPKYKIKEFNYGHFERKFKLPLTIDSSTISASLENGILNIKLMKRADEIDNGPKEINVQ